MCVGKLIDNLNNKAINHWILKLYGCSMKIMVTIAVMAFVIIINKTEITWTYQVKQLFFPSERL